MTEGYKIIKVRCTFIIPVEVPDSTTEEWKDYNEFFDIEENHCCGTGNVGAVIDARIKWADENNFCWACGLEEEKCEII